VNPPSHKAGDRRPITTRDTQGAKRLPHWLARRGVRPNTISLWGMVAGVLAGGMLAATSWLPEWARLCWVLGAGFIQLRLLAKMLEGMVAVETGRASALGELFNEVPDRISDAAILIGLGYAAGAQITLGYLAACLALFVAYLRAAGRVAGAPQEFCGPLAKPQRMFLATVAALYGGLAPAAWPLSPAAHPKQGIGFWILALIIAGCVWTALRRLRRIVRALQSLHHS